MAINIKELTKWKSMKMSQSEVERVVKEYVEKNWKRKWRAKNERRCTRYYIGNRWNFRE